MNERPAVEKADVGRVIAGGCLACVVAPIPVLLIVIAMSRDFHLGSVLVLGPAFISVGGVIAFAHFALLGLPLFLLMQRRYRTQVWICALAGVIVGTLPMTIWGLATGLPVDGRGLEILAVLAPAGLVGGAAFGLIVKRWGRRRHPVDPRIFH